MMDTPAIADKEEVVVKDEPPGEPLDLSSNRDQKIETTTSVEKEGDISPQPNSKKVDTPNSSAEQVDRDKTP